MSNFDVNTLRLNEFKLENMCEHPAIVMIAKRGSGKSWVARDIIYKMKDVMSGGIIISQTDHVEPFYKNFFPDIYIHDEYKSEIISNMLRRQEAVKLKVKERNSKINTSTLLVMDDCLSDDTWKKDRCIKEIFMNGRHYNLTYILTMQYPLGIKPDLRSNFDYIFVLACDFISIRKKIYEQYAGMIPSYDIFEKLLDICTENYGCMVINNRSCSKEITDRIYWYRAQKRENFTFGSDKFKLFHKENYEENYRYRNKSLDFTSYKKKSTPVLNVIKV